MLTRVVSVNAPVAVPFAGIAEVAGHPDLSQLAVAVLVKLAGDGPPGP